MKTRFTAIFCDVPEGYIGYAEDLPGANTQGLTREDVGESIREAIKLTLAATGIAADSRLRRNQGRMPAVPNTPTPKVADSPWKPAIERAVLTKYLEDQGCEMVLRGAQHNAYLNAALDRAASVPQCEAVNAFLVRKICNDLKIPVPVQI